MTNVNKYHVKSYYCTTGMEGIPEINDYGIIEAESEDEAKDIIVNQEYPEDIKYGPDGNRSAQEFFKNFLTATEVTNDQ